MKTLKRRDFDPARVITPKWSPERTYRTEEMIWRRPVVRLVTDDRKRDAELVVGRHEMHRRIVEGKTSVLCSVIACTDSEFRFLQRADVLSPRLGLDNSPGVALEVLDYLVEKFGEHADELKTGIGRPRTALGAFRELLSTQRGTKRGALAQAATRRKQEAAEPGRAIERAASPEPIDTFGLELEEDFHGGITQILSAIYSARASVTTALRTIKTLRELEFPAPLYGEILNTTESLGKLLEDIQPVSLCLHCKGVEELMERCAFCMRTGWSPKRALKGANPMLLDRENLMVVDGGIIKPMDDFLDDDEPESGEPDDDFWDNPQTAVGEVPNEVVEDIWDGP